ncbi:MFS transporter [Pseudomonas protegens]|uniref:MFS transporter n=1 Tax=Pseudomonas protegens TaxID=380021 RepID=UPI001C6945C0|nr:MFS transporter [Pseudomonas protegens]QYN03677.1 MFS transporter [Pseudomonas protegens]
MKGLSHSDASAPINVTLLMCSVAIVGSNGLLLSPILSDVASSLAAPLNSAAIAMSSYGAGTAISALFLAPLIDRHGASWALKTGLIALLLSLFGSSSAISVAMLIVFQASAGVAAGLVLPSAYALATKFTSPEFASQALGKVLIGWSLSLVAGVPLSALITEYAGWRVAYLCLAVSATIIFSCLPQSPRYPRKNEEEVSWPTPFRALKETGVRPLLTIGLAFTSSFYGTYAFVVQETHTVLQTSTAQAGQVVLAFGLGFASASIANRWIDQVGPQKVLPWILMINATIFASMALTMTSLVTFLAVAFCWGFANHLTLNSIVLLLSQSSDGQRGAILGLNSATTYAGLTIGTIVASLIYPVAGFERILLVAATVQIAAALLAFYRIRAQH